MCLIYRGSIFACLSLCIHSVQDIDILCMQLIDHAAALVLWRPQESQQPFSSPLSGAQTLRLLKEVH